MTVVLNVWSDHVSTYTADAGDHVPEKTTEQEEWAEDLLFTAKAEDDAHGYDDMLEMDWS